MCVCVCMPVMCVCMHVCDVCMCIYVCVLVAGPFVVFSAFDKRERERL